MAIIQEEITIGANKFYKIYSDNGYMLKNNYNTIQREFYNKNYIEVIKDNYTEIIDQSIDITNDELIQGIAQIISSDIQDNVNEQINTLTQDVIELTGDVDTNTVNINDLSTNVNSNINDLSANITVLSNDIGDLNLDNVLQYYNIKSEEKYEETNSGTDNYTISTGFYICASKLGIKNNSDKNKLKSLTIKIGTNAGAGADCDNVKAILLNVNDAGDVLESSNIVSIKPADSNAIKTFEFNTNISNIDINAIYKVIFINTGTGSAIKINYRVFACDENYKTYLNLVDSANLRPIVSVYFEELTDYILQHNTINDANIGNQTDKFVNKTFIKTSDDLILVRSNWPNGYPLKLYPRFFKPSSNKINLNSISLHCPADSRNKDIELQLSVKKYIYEDYKPLIATSENSVKLTGNEQIITFEFKNLELDVDTFYMFEHGKNISLYAINGSAGTSEDNMNCILLYIADQTKCNLPALSANFDDNIGEFIRDKSFNKEVSSIVENYLVDYDPAVDENRVHDIVDQTFNSRIINISDDDYKTLLDNNQLDPNVIYVLSSSNNTIDICEKRIINVEDGIEDSDAATIGQLKLSTEILTQMITDLTNRLNALENN